MTLKTEPYDSAEFLTSGEAIAEYLTAAFESEDSAHIAHAIGVVARAKGMTDLAREAGVSRTSLYRALSAQGRPELPTLLAVLKAVGVRLTAVERAA
jgi:probable addiction module antidote protein